MTGRPSDYSDEIADRICERLVEGESLRSICSSDEMPNKSTVFRWLEKHEVFATKYARARELQAECEADEMVEIADDGRNDWMERNADGERGWRENGEHIQRSRLRVATRQWRAEKLLPKVYGNKQQVEHSGSVTLEQLIMQSYETKGSE